MLVVDASAMVEVLLGRPVADRVAAALRRGGALRAPHVLDLEVLGALRRALQRGWVDGARAALAVAALGDLPVLRVTHEPFVEAIWRWRDLLTPCDAAYVALAEALAPDGAALLTADARLARTVRGHSDLEVLLAA